MKPPPIITCPQWGARPPKAPTVEVGRPQRVIVHHTAGLAARGVASAREQAIQYARALQHLHMDVRGWNDSGHNFLVMRSGVIVQGRWGTVTALEHGRMVESAHCPGENDQPGIEHEHAEGQMTPASANHMTPAQFNASADLIAWICHLTGIRPTQLFPHSLYYPTACPGALLEQLPHLRLAVAGRLTTAKNTPQV